jgi:hypothetical protein
MRQRKRGKAELFVGPRAVAAVAPEATMVATIERELPLWQYDFIGTLTKAQAAIAGANRIFNM